MQYIKSVFWSFGDGRTSTEYNPTHVYSMPGKYFWVFIVWDVFGRSITVSGFINVYDWDYLTGDLHVAYTDKCYRFAMKPKEGVGGCEWGGDNWIWPTAYAGTCKGFTDAGETVSLVMDNHNGRFYQIGIAEQWKDRYGAYEKHHDIACRFKIKEHIAEAGEYQEIEHIESHVHMRPFWETNRSLGGFTADGFLDAYALGLRMYENGDPVTPLAKLQEVPRYGDYVYRKRVEARRLQLEVLLDTSAWRCIKVQQRFMPIDKAAAPDYDYPPEVQWQQEFGTPDLWLTRDSFKPTMNYATGVVFAGTHDTFAIGPDGYANTGLNFAVAQGLYASNCAYINGDMTLGLWIAGIGAAPITLWRMNVDNGATLLVTIDNIAGVYAVRWNDGTNGDTRTLAWAGASWVFIAVEKSGATLRVFENGVQLSLTPLIDATLGYGNTIYFAENSICSIFDVRRTPRAISTEALQYYYDDVVNNAGNGGFLPIRR